ncbi:MAG: ABC transporter ATP-binding protein [Lachnospiraceae bacterium]|nr:ABC transporter ATP-binding protein [Lachnospiraceae bacterium]
MRDAIKINNISKSFGSKTVLDDINLDVEEGEIFGLLGPSGAGKTTLIKILTGQLKGEHGTTAINGINSQQLKSTDYSSFGIMMDNFGVYERLSCFDNLKVFARIYRLDEEDIRAALSDVGLGSAGKTAAGNLSKGMKNRLRLARVFMINPSVLFLDEPTSGLDPATSEDIQQLILAEKKKGKTIFLTTHNMAEAEKLCDHVALLHKGKIVEYGSPQEVCRRYNHQKKLLIHLTDGTDKEIPTDTHSDETVYELMKNNLVETIHSSEPNLETVFLELTGEELAR